MRVAGRVSAAIAVLEDFETRRVPLKTALADWARGARYAGSKDRAWIAGLALDVLRRRRSLSALMGDGSVRSATLAALRGLWRMDVVEIADMAGEAPHGPGALSQAELAALDRMSAPIIDMSTEQGSASLGEAGDFPDWLEPHVRRAFGDSALAEMTALAARADVDLRVNTLKTDPEKAISALQVIGAGSHPLIKRAARVAAPPASDKTPDVTIIPAFNKGWVEVQDAGSQIAALSAWPLKGAQALDYCAGGGGKTLALAALMENKGQLYAYDCDAARLKPLYARAQRAGVRNLQILNPLTDESRLGALKGKMDIVFIDAPCTGSGVWRRHPDSKWRLTPDQLALRISEQDQVLASAADYVESGGRLVYATCSIFSEENGDRIAAFLDRRRDFRRASALEAIRASGLLTADGATLVAECADETGTLRLTPLRTRTDGFFISALTRA